MIAAHFVKPDGTDSLLLVLEPGNIEKLKLGQPILKQLREFLPGVEREVELCIAFTPDPMWVAQQWRKHGDLGKAIDDSLTRPEVLGGHDPEKLVEEKL